MNMHTLGSRSTASDHVLAARLVNLPCHEFCNTVEFWLQHYEWYATAKAKSTSAHDFK